VNADRLQRAIVVVRQTQRKVNGERRAMNRCGTGGLSCSLANNLARGARQAVSSRGRRLGAASADPGSMPPRRRLAMVVENGNPCQVDLQQHQRVNSESVPKSANRPSSHSSPILQDMGALGRPNFALPRLRRIGLRWGDP
jgi:hypothetical protein